MWMPPPPPPRGGGFARGILVTLATTIFGLSLTLNLYLLLTSGLMSAGGGTRSTNIVDGDPNQKIIVIPVNGAIMDSAFERFDRAFKQIENDKGVKALVLEIDSPGGTVSASDQMLHRVLRYKADHTNVPVVVSMGGLAASGGYYVACGGDYVFAQPTTLTGSIGVLFPIFNASELGEKWGIHDATVESSGTPFKDVGSMLKPMTPEQRAYIQDLADKAFAQFKGVITTGRAGKLKKPLPEIANGKVYMATDAKAMGLVDDIGYLHDAYDYAAKKAGVSKPTVIKIQEPKGLLSVLAGDEKTNIDRGTASMKVNGVNVSVSDLVELTTPRLMYLWRGQ